MLIPKCHQLRIVIAIRECSLMTRDYCLASSLVFRQKASGICADEGLVTALYTNTGDGGCCFDISPFDLFFVSGPWRFRMRKKYLCACVLECKLYLILTCRILRLQMMGVWWVAISKCMVKWKFVFLRNVINMRFYT